MSIAHWGPRNPSERTLLSDLAREISPDKGGNVVLFWSSLILVLQVLNSPPKAPYFTRSQLAATCSPPSVPQSPFVRYHSQGLRIACCNHGVVQLPTGQELLSLQERNNAKTR